MEFGNYFVEIKGSFFFFFSLIIISAVWSFFVYRRTVPPASSYWKITLGCLRFFALLIILFLLFEPVIKYETQKSLKPLLPVVIDDTQSMHLKDRLGDRSVKLAELLNQPVWNSLRDSFDVQFYSGGDSLHYIADFSPDSLTFSTVGTDLTKFWRGISLRLDADAYPACIIISDGGDNEGLDPLLEAEKAAKPLITIGVGDTATVTDAGIAGIIGNSVAYKDKESSVTVRIQARGMEDQRAQLLLKDQSGTVLNSKEIRLATDGLLQEVELPFTLKEPGKQVLTAELVTTRDEWSGQNNDRGFPIIVKESKIRVLVVAGLPSFESMFLEQTLSELKDVDYHTLTFKKGGGFYNFQVGDLGRLFSESDVLILLNITAAERASNSYRQVLDEIRKTALPRWLWLTSNTDVRVLDDFIPDHGTLINRNPRITEAQAVPRRYYEVLEPDAEFEEEVWWKDVPPVKLPDRIIQQGGSGTSLVDLINPETGETVSAGLLVWDDNGRKAALSLGDGIWRWSFLQQGLSGQKELYTRHLFRMIRWLSAVQEEKPLKLETDKYLYSSGENVIFDAQAFTPDGKPIKTAIIEVQIEGPSDTTKLLIEPDAAGQYRTKYLPASAGKYRFTGIAKHQDQVIASDSGEFSVEAYNIEKETLTQNYRLLQSIAESSGGSYFDENNIEALPDKIGATPRLVTIGWSRRMFLGWDFWFLPILFLSLEWIIRKRKGML